MAWAKNGTPNTLSGAADDLDINDLTAYKFNQFLIHSLSTAATDHRATFDNNGNTDYAWRRSANGGTDATATSQAYIDFNIGLSQASDKFGVIYGVNIDSEEKLFISFEVEYPATGAASPPDRNEVVSKIDTSTNTGQYTDIDINNTLAGDYLTSSNLSALGTD